MSMSALLFSIDAICCEEGGCSKILKDGSRELPTWDSEVGNLLNDGNIIAGQRSSD